MIIAKRLSRHFCSQTPNQIIKYQHYSQLECKQLIRKQNTLRSIILQKIDEFGEMKVEHYWKLAMTDQEFGYYSDKNVFSREGDFTTSPEISPLFGEMIAVWILYFLQKTDVVDQGTQKVKKRFRIVQLGGGRGLLMKDIINSFRDVNVIDNFQITFIQVSEHNRKCQQDSVMESFKKNDHYFRFEHELAKEDYESFVSENEEKSVNLRWFQNLEAMYYRDTENEKNGQEIPLTIFVMNQFMDALPVTTLSYTEKGWREKVLRRSNQQELYVELGISDNHPHQKFIPVVTEEPAVGQQIQLSPESLLTMDLMAKIVNKRGGAILNIDYGDDGYFTDSIRGIKNHQYVPSPYLWQIPGQCDISAYVNFEALAKFAERNEGIRAFETIPQGYFLQAMGIVHRVDILKEKMDEQNRKRLDSEEQKLVDASQMGQIYKVQIITKKEYGDLYPFIEIDENTF